MASDACLGRGVAPSRDMSSLGSRSVKGIKGEVATATPSPTTPPVSRPMRLGSRLFNRLEVPHVSSDSRLALATELLSFSPRELSVAPETDVESGPRISAKVGGGRVRGGKGIGGGILSDRWCCMVDGGRLR